MKKVSAPAVPQQDKQGSKGNSEPLVEDASISTSIPQQHSSPLNLKPSSSTKQENNIATAAMGDPGTGSSTPKKNSSEDISKSVESPPPKVGETPAPQSSTTRSKIQENSMPPGRVLKDSSQPQLLGTQQLGPVAAGAIATCNNPKEAQGMASSTLITTPAVKKPFAAAIRHVLLAKSSPPADELNTKEASPALVTQATLPVPAVRTGTDKPKESTLPSTADSAKSHPLPQQKQHDMQPSSASFMAYILANSKSSQQPIVAAAQSSAANKSVSAASATIDAKAAIHNLWLQVLAECAPPPKPDEHVATLQAEASTTATMPKQSVLEAAQEFARRLAAHGNAPATFTVPPRPAPTPNSVAAVINAQSAAIHGLSRQVITQNLEETQQAQAREQLRRAEIQIAKAQREQLANQKLQDPERKSVIAEKAVALQKRSQQFLTTTQKIQQEHADAARRRQNMQREQREQQRKREQQRQPQPVSTAVLPARSFRRPVVDAEAAAILDAEVAAIQKLSLQVRTQVNPHSQQDQAEEEARREEAKQEKREQQQRKEELLKRETAQRETAQREKTERHRLQLQKQQRQKQQSQKQQQPKFPFVPVTTNSAQAALEAIQNIARGVQISVGGDPSQTEPGTPHAAVPSAQQMLKEFHKRMQIKRDSERMSKEKEPAKKDLERQDFSSDQLSQAYEMAKAQQAALAANKRQKQTSADRIKDVPAGQIGPSVQGEKKKPSRILMMDDIDGDEVFLKTRAQQIVDETLGRQKPVNPRSVLVGASRPTTTNSKHAQEPQRAVVGASPSITKPAPKSSHVVDLTVPEKDQASTKHCLPTANTVSKIPGEGSMQSKPLSVPNPLLQLPKRTETQRRVSYWTIDESDRTEASDTGYGDKEIPVVKGSVSTKEPTVPNPLSQRPHEPGWTSQKSGERNPNATAKPSLNGPWEKQADNTIKALLAGRRVSLEERVKEGSLNDMPCPGQQQDSQEQKNHGSSNEQRWLSSQERQGDKKDGGIKTGDGNQSSGPIGVETSISPHLLVRRLLGDSPVSGDEAPIELGPQMIKSLGTLLRHELKKMRLSGEKRKRESEETEEANKQLKTFAQQQSEIVHQQKVQLASYQQQLTSLSAKISEQSDELNSLQSTQRDVICNLLNQLKIGMQVAVRQKKEIIALREVIKEDADLIVEKNSAIVALREKLDQQEESIRKLREDAGSSDSLREEIQELQESLEEEREESAIFVKAYARATLHALSMKSKQL